MNWTKWSSIAEIFSSIAILVTLVFLTIQIQQNNANLQAATRDSVANTDIDSLRGVVERPELWLTLVKPNLTDAEAISLTAYLTSILRQGERSWFQYQSGALDEAAWSSYQIALFNTFSFTQSRKYWNAVVGEGNSGFRDHLNTLLQDRPIVSDIGILNVYD